MESNNENIVELWLHNQPIIEGRTAGGIWRSFSEPLLRNGIFELTPKARDAGDKFVYINSAARIFIGEDLLRSIKPGEKVCITVRTTIDVRD